MDPRPIVTIKRFIRFLDNQFQVHTLLRLLIVLIVVQSWDLRLQPKEGAKSGFVKDCGNWDLDGRRTCGSTH